MQQNLANLKFDVDKLDINQLKNVPTTLSNLKSKVAKLDIDKLVPVPVDLSELNDVINNDAVKKDVCNANIKNIEDKTPYITNLATNDSIIAKVNEVKGEIPHIINLATIAALTAVENKIPSVSNLVKDYNTKISEIENKVTIIMIMINTLLLKNLIG